MVTSAGSGGSFGGPSSGRALPSRDAGPDTAGGAFSGTSRPATGEETIRQVGDTDGAREVADAADQQRKARSTTAKGRKSSKKGGARKKGASKKKGARKSTKRRGY